MVKNVFKRINLQILNIILNAIYLFVIGLFSVVRIFDPLKLKPRSDTMLRQRRITKVNKEKFDKPY